MNRIMKYAQAFAFGAALGLLLLSASGCDTIVEIDATEFRSSSELDKTRWQGQVWYDPSVGVNDSLDVTFGFEDVDQLVGRGTYTVGRFADRFEQAMNMLIKEYAAGEYTFTIFAFGQAWVGEASLDGDTLRIRRPETPDRTYVLHRIR